MATQQRVQITDANGVPGTHKFSVGDGVNIGTDGDWLFIGVVRTTDKMVRNLMGQDVPEIVQIYQATVWRGTVTTELVEDDDDA